MTASSAPVVTLTGPRQSGKTTLIRSTFPEHEYLSLEAPDIRSRAREDPPGLFAESDRMILDEIQREPDLLSYIQVLVDEDSRPGRFVLTGSQNLLLMESVSQTLAGRTALLRLFPFSLAELHGRPRLDASSLTGTCAAAAPTAELWETLWAGFYPGFMTASSIRASGWPITFEPTSREICGS
ncbi:MAG: AAA family ATPase [bacterium]|nr:AAA family ATPase [bacterium]